MKRIILITGGQRSGKSSYAEQRALRLSATPIYIATAHLWDEEFRERVKRHQTRRGPNWTTIEEEKNLSRCHLSHQVVVIDCLTLWCTNFFYDPNKENDQQPSAEEVLQNMKTEFNQFTNQEDTFIFVTNEIGWGGTSTHPVQRRFTDVMGWFNQYVAARADEVILMVSGIPVTIKNNQ